jgi:hypothetical protein
MSWTDGPRLAKDSRSVVIASDQTPIPVTIEGGATGGSSGGLTNTELRAAPVSVTFTNNSLPVTGPLTDAQLRANPIPVTFSNSTIAVTGTFWPATQPVSIASMPVTPVTGTFWQATQPVSIASTINVQPVRDNARTTICLTAEVNTSATAEGLLTMTMSSNSATTSTFTSRVIPSGKKFRIQSVIIQIEALGTGTAPQRAYLRMRANAAGATTTTSPIQFVIPVGTNTAVVKSSSWSSLDFPEGLEFAGNGTATIGFTLETPDFVATTATGRVKITIVGYEY